MFKIKIPWYMFDSRFEPGTVADIGNIRLELKRRHQEKNQNWRLYMYIRTREEDGVHQTLKRGVAVAEFNKNYTLEEAQEKANEYLERFVVNIAAARMEE